MVKSMNYSLKLKDENEIADYVEMISPDEVDLGLIREMFQNSFAELRLISISALTYGPEELHVPNKSKQRAYDKLTAEDAPPILIDGETFLVYDGCHRVRSSKKQGLEKVRAYLIFPK